MKGYFIQRSCHDTCAIRPARMKGLVLQIKQVEELLGRMRGLTVSERALLPGLDPGRADVILAGTAVVAEILKFFHSSEMTVSLTDLLEGTVLDLLGVPLGQ